MPSYPSNVSTVTVTGYWTNSDGTGPARGTVTFIPNSTLQDGTSSPAAIVLPTPLTATLSNGAISVQLMATDDPHLAPVNWTYMVIENIDSQTATRTYYIQLPAAQTPVDLSTIAPLATLPAPVGYVAGTPYTVQAFSEAGTVSASVGTGRIYYDAGRTLIIKAVRASVGTAPEGADLIIDIKKNGTTIFTNPAHRPTIPAGGYTSGKVTNMDVLALNDGDYFTVDVVQVGSSVSGSDLVVQVWAA